MNTKGVWLSYCCGIHLLVALTLLTQCSGNKEQRKRQDFARGKMLYQKHCQNCHKADGKGFKQLYPPLKQVPYMKANPEEVACILRYGMEGPLTIKGEQYNLHMPGNESLTDHRIAQVMTYIYNAWGNDHPRFTADFVSKSLEGCDTIVRVQE